eukprot:1153081-Pelagomonas_calceolata.AAC.8
MSVSPPSSQFFQALGHIPEGALHVGADEPPVAHARGGSDGGGNAADPAIGPRMLQHTKHNTYQQKETESMNC